MSSSYPTSAPKDDFVRQFYRSFRVSISPLDTHPATLYHYTGAAGVTGILTEGKLRATNYSFLNDPTEVQHGLDLAHSVLNDEKDQATRSDRKKLLAVIEENLSKQTMAEVYVCCFTTCRDDLSQWRAYGTAMGARYCIGFHTEELLERVEERLPALKLFRKVEYELDKQSALIRKEIRRAIDFVPERCLLENEIRSLAEAVAGQLANLFPEMKSPSYSAEEEWRLICPVFAESVLDVCFDSTRGFVRPYIEIPVAYDKSPIPIDEMLVLAPGRQFPSVKAADMLLRKVGITNVQAKDSRVPFVE